MFKHCDHCGIDYFLFHNCVVNKKESLIETPKELGLSVLKEEVIKEEESPKELPQETLDEFYKKNQGSFSSSCSFIPHMFVSSAMCMADNSYIDIHKNKFMNRYYAETQRREYERQLNREKLTKTNFPDKENFPYNVFPNSDGF